MGKQWVEHNAHLCSDSTIGLCCYMTADILIHLNSHVHDR